MDNNSHKSVLIRLSAPGYNDNDPVAYQQAGNTIDYLVERVYSDQISTQTIYNEQVGPRLPGILAGRQVTVLTYGKTATGKSFTMNGTQNQVGLRVHCLQELFWATHQMDAKISASAFEIYNEKIFDLSDQPKEFPLAKLKISSTNEGRVSITNLSQVNLPTFEAAIAFHNQTKRSKQGGQHKMNANCGISVIVFKINVQMGDIIGSIQFVDMPGTQRMIGGCTNETTQVAIEYLIQECININKSLMAFDNVILQSPPTPNSLIRGSKVTEYLKEILQKLMKNVSLPTADLVFIACVKMQQNVLIESLRTLLIATKFHSY